MADETTRWNQEGEFAFARWETPFENAEIDVLNAEYSYHKILSVELVTLDRELNYFVTFQQVEGFRVLDEAGLAEIWAQTELLGGRPGRSTFKVRNHLWTGESPLTFFAADGWSFIIASGDECVEVVTSKLPEISVGCSMKRRSASHLVGFRVSGLSLEARSSNRSESK